MVMKEKIKITCNELQYIHCIYFQISGTYSKLSDEQLDELLRCAQQSHPNIGIRMAKGLLQSNGHRVQSERIRQSFLRTDPIGVMQRWRDAVRRRRYNVQCPLALWHIDGNHKLIR